MTAAVGTIAPSHVQRSASSRIWNVVRLQYTNRWLILGIPWVVLGTIFLLNVAIWGIIAMASNGTASMEGTTWSGGASYAFIYMLVLAIQAINSTFPFALGYSVTRRDYYLGTALTFIIQSAIFAVGFVILSFIEDWTKGWWLNGHFFTVVYFGGSGAIWERFFDPFALFLFFFFIGMTAAAVYVRWKANGLMILGIVFALIVVGSVFLVTATQSWGAVGDWFVASGATGVVAWSLVPTVICLVAGYFILRRATPKN